MEIVVERHQAMCIHATQHTVEYAGTNKRLVVVATVPSYAEEISLCNRSASHSLYMRALRPYSTVEVCICVRIMECVTLGNRLTKRYKHLSRKQTAASP